jgi:hypothetical protein
MFVMGAILERLTEGRLPVGWVQITGRSDEDVSNLCAEIMGWAGDSGIVVNTTGDLWPQNGMTVAKAGPDVMSFLGTLLQARLFRVYLIRWWDAVGPPDEQWGNPWMRVVWLSRWIAELRRSIHAAGATVIAASCSERAGGRLFQASLGLRFVVRPNGGGLVVSMTGRAVRPASMPFVVREA